MKLKILNFDWHSNRTSMFILYATSGWVLVMKLPKILSWHCQSLSSWSYIRGKSGSLPLECCPVRRSTRVGSNLVCNYDTKRNGQLEESQVIKSHSMFLGLYHKTFYFQNDFSSIASQCISLRWLKQQTFWKTQAY